MNSVTFTYLPTTQDLSQVLPLSTPLIAYRLLYLRKPTNHCKPIAYMLTVNYKAIVNDKVRHRGQ